MASTEKLPSGKYRPIARDSNGKKITGLGTFDRKRDAQHAADEAEVKARRQAARLTGTLPASITWGEWWDILVEDRTFESETTTFEASAVKNHLRPYWGNEPLNKISNTKIQKWIDSFATKRTPRGGRYSPASVIRFYGVFTVSINQAIDAGILTSSPLVKIRLPRVARKAKPYMSVAESEQYSGRLRADYADIVEFGLETGLRPGEIAGLHDDEVNTETAIMTVRTVYVPRNKRMRNSPKDTDEREIPLTAKALEIYQRRTAGRDMRRPCGIEHYSERCHSALVFLTVRGRPLSSDALWKALRRAAQAADGKGTRPARSGLPARSGYTLRRGFATRLREAGADPFMIADLMGHEKLDQTRGYVQQGPEFARQARSALGDLDASGLRVVEAEGVGQESGGRGTDLDSQPLTDVHADRRQNVS